jgi:hypothetical protein
MCPRVFLSNRKNRTIDPDRFYAMIKKVSEGIGTDAPF